MKGGKGGRARRGAGTAGRQGGGRSKVKKGSAQRPVNAPPKKGSPKKPQYGGTPSSSDE